MNKLVFLALLAALGILAGFLTSCAGLSLQTNPDGSFSGGYVPPRPVIIQPAK